MLRWRETRNSPEGRLFDRACQVRVQKMPVAFNRRVTARQGWMEVQSCPRKPLGQCSKTVVRS
jgi:hypothetical protein